MDNITSIMEESTEKFNEVANDTMGVIGKNKYLSAALTLTLVLYAGFAAPKLPDNVALMFENPIVQFVMAAMIVYSSGSDPVVAVAASVAFMATLYAINNIKLGRVVSAVTAERELFEDQEYVQEVVYPQVIPNNYVNVEEQNNPQDVQNLNEEIGNEQDEVMNEIVEDIAPNSSGNNNNMATIEEAEQDSLIQELPPSNSGLNHRHNSEFRQAPQVIQHQPFRFGSRHCGSQKGGKCGCKSGKTCAVCAKYRNSFYPQYVRNSPWAYEARDNVERIRGYDPHSRLNKGGLNFPYNS